MIKDTHTPGPWVILPEEADREYIRIRGTRLGGQYKIANVLFLRNEGKILFAREVQANARLIAAAPELLEALTELLKESSYWTKQRCADACEPYGMGTDAEAKAWAAIANATTPKV
jgi:hypothetical protein